MAIDGYTGNWYYKANVASHASCSSSAVSGAARDVENLSSDTSCTYTAYRDRSCGTELASASSFLPVICLKGDRRGSGWYVP